MTKPINFPYAKRAFPNSHRVWPMERQLMSDAPMIAMRMAEDVSELIRGRGAEAVITVDDLAGQGWSFEQVRRFGDAAIALIRSDEGHHVNAA